MTSKNPIVANALEEREACNACGDDVAENADENARKMKQAYDNCKSAVNLIEKAAFIIAYDEEKSQGLFDAMGHLKRAMLSMK